MKLAPKPLYQEDLEIMNAKHVLWLYEQPGGERADFTNRELRELNLFHMNFKHAIFAGAALEDCCLDEGNFTNCDFTGASLRNNLAVNAEFNGVRFEDAVIENCNFQTAWCMRMGLEGAQFTSSDFTGADTEDTDFSQAELVGCEGLEDIAQGPAMTMGG